MSNIFKINCFIIVNLILSVLICGCGSKKKNISDGNTYYDQKLNIEICPPKGWIIFDNENYLVDGVAFYPPKIKNTRFYITSRTNIKEKLIPDSKSKSFDEKVNEYRLRLKKLPKSKIVRDEKVILNSIPAHIIETNYITKGITPSEDKAYYINHNNRFYVISFWILKDRYYKRNIYLIEKSIKTLIFKKSNYKNS